MARFEVTGTATDVFALDAIKAALHEVGAADVRERRAFGWRNQPRVATFRAEDRDSAMALCDAARAKLPREGGLPALLPYQY